MKQPYRFKKWRDSWEQEPIAYTCRHRSDEDHLKELRNVALRAIKEYKTEKLRIEAERIETEKLFKFFEYIDNITDK